MSNHLAKEESPYLKQHADNPVDWYAWGDEAFLRAVKENKPILLSIGYAACHWCHVMAHESFEDLETAKVMNDLFINIKVDREERPDLDKIYQTAHYLLTHQNGGWPLTVFLTPKDLMPFFSGTYFPKESRYHLPAFKDVLRGIAKAYREQHNHIQQQNVDLLSFLQSEKPLTENELNAKPIELAIQQLAQQFDQVHGGFGHAPKFPQAPKLAFLLDQGNEMASFTLAKMASGGINDQIGGGFYRYAVDEKWEIPHFEKMLYDNAQLLSLYAQAAKQAPDQHFANILKETFVWLQHKMQTPSGVFYASLDADSDGHEGLYYLWNKKEVKNLLDEKEYALVERYFGLDKNSNFEDRWHFYQTMPLAQVASDLQLSLTDAEKYLLSAKQKLLSAREKRTSPALDTKILTAWNSLAIPGILEAAQVLNEPEMVSFAMKMLHFIQKNLWVNDRLRAAYYQHKNSPADYLDDYAFLSAALLKALQVSWDTQNLIFLQQLLTVILDHFYDQKHGGFYFTADDHPTPVYRPKTMMDEAIPNGNGIIVSVLLVMGHLLNEVKYLDAAEKTLKAAWPALEHYPSEHSSLLKGLQYYLTPPNIIIIRGQPDEITTWQKAVNTANNSVFAIPETANLPPALAEKKLKGRISAYICHGTSCREVIDDFEAFLKMTRSPGE